MEVVGSQFNAVQPIRLGKIQWKRFRQATFSGPAEDLSTAK
jgi:hypothetical protein